MTLSMSAGHVDVYKARDNDDPQMSAGHVDVRERPFSMSAGTHTHMTHVCWPC